MGTVLTFRDDDLQPRAEVMLGNGDHVRIAMDANGLTIAQIGEGDGSPAILFQADRSLVGRICAALVISPREPNASPLRIIVAAVTQIQSAGDVRDAFNAAIAEIS